MPDESDNSDDFSGSEATANMAKTGAEALDAAKDAVVGIMDRAQGDSSDSAGGSDAGGGDTASGEDETKKDVEKGFEAASAAMEAVEHGSEVGHDVDHAVDEYSQGHGWGGTADSIDAGSAAEGHMADVLGSLGSMTDDRGLQDAAAVVRTAQQVSRVVGSVVREVGEIVDHVREHAAEESRRVEYEVYIDGYDQEWEVESVQMTETLSDTYEAVIHLHCDDADLDVVQRSPRPRRRRPRQAPRRLQPAPRRHHRSRGRRGITASPHARGDSHRARAGAAGAGTRHAHLSGQNRGRDRPGGARAGARALQPRGRRGPVDRHLRPP